MLTTHPRTLLVVICEAAIEQPLIEDLMRLGAQGYTIADVRGRGRGGARDASWEADRSIELKVVCDSGLAERLAAHVLQHYAPHYAVTLYLHPVAVVRADKF